jgi:hypothetical protein
MDDHTSRYMGEAVELALFGGEYQDGVLTSYCVVADVPLQNVASLHCTSRCDAQDDWPPRGLLDEDDGPSDDPS